jgi:CRP/FNR family transcriptional regulator, cyclic AMP receptor protein
MAAIMESGTRPAGERWLRVVHERGAVVPLLQADPALASVVPADQRARADELLHVRTERLEPGEWRPAEEDHDPHGLGLLLLEGFVYRSVTIRGRCCGELLGAGDLLRPWVGDGADSSVGQDACWRVLQPVRLAVLDRRASAVVGRVPALTAELLDRTVARSRALQLQLTLTQVPGIAQRLHLLLWHLADRWGRVTPHGVVVPIRLTHHQLGTLLGARRPSITTAVRTLVAGGWAVQEGDAWLLRGDPEDEIREDSAA